jgi:predicted transglutaminase-like cysteine proteinase
MQRLSIILLLLAIPLVSIASNADSLDAANNGSLFGYTEVRKQNLDMFPQWLSVLERHLLDTTTAGSCKSTRFNRCHLRQWLAFLDSIKNQSEKEQINRVNRFANTREYILDQENYGIADYWATPKEFLINNGDCEDFAIIKMLSLKRLGYDVSKMRVVVVQDTNLRIPHAVMALDKGGDFLILDNQIEQVISHNDVFHYVPVYSVNENNWWMHVPN